jgi:hypothetical protein
MFNEGGMNAGVSAVEMTSQSNRNSGSCEDVTRQSKVKRAAACSVQVVTNSRTNVQPPSSRNQGPATMHNSVH